jgi:nicotinamidase-related amidase
MKTALLIIDMQNDFCLPAGSLSIPGAEKDVEELSRFIGRASETLDSIILTQDNHQVVNIAHPGYWQDAHGNPPPPFTNITRADLLQQRWIPRYNAEKVKDYIQKLEEQGEYVHTVWPEHCLMGSTGAAIVQPVMEKVADWARSGRYYEIVIKGTHPLTEHFGAFRANIPIPDAPETGLNTGLIDKLRSFDRIFIAGEARSHCVANTIRQLFDFPEIVRNLVILNNCMSNVPNCDLLAKPIFDNAVEMGAKLIDTTDITF